MPKRICDHCGKEIEYDGFVIDDGTTYYCSEECLHQVISEEEYLEMYNEGLAYYTTFEDDEDDE